VRRIPITCNFCVDALRETDSVKCWRLSGCFTPRLHCLAEHREACSASDTGFNEQAVPHQPAADAASSAAQLGAGL